MFVHLSSTCRVASLAKVRLRLGVNQAAHVCWHFRIARFVPEVPLPTNTKMIAEWQPKDANPSAKADRILILLIQEGTLGGQRLAKKMRRQGWRQRE
jgi:hypothetical protein